MRLRSRTVESYESDDNDDAVSISSSSTQSESSPPESPIIPCYTAAFGHDILENPEDPVVALATIGWLQLHDNRPPVTEYQMSKRFGRVGNITIFIRNQCARFPLTLKHKVIRFKHIIEILSDSPLLSSGASPGEADRQLFRDTISTLPAAVVEGVTLDKLTESEQQAYNEEMEMVADLEKHRAKYSAYCDLRKSGLDDWTATELLMGNENESELEQDEQELEQCEEECRIIEKLYEEEREEQAQHELNEQKKREEQAQQQQLEDQKKHEEQAQHELNEQKKREEQAQHKLNEQKKRKEHAQQQLEEKKRHLREEKQRQERNKRESERQRRQQKDCNLHHKPNQQQYVPSHATSSFSANVARSLLQTQSATTQLQQSTRVFSNTNSNRHIHLTPTVPTLPTLRCDDPKSVRVETFTNEGNSQQGNGLRRLFAAVFLRSRLPFSSQTVVD